MRDLLPKGRLEAFADGVLAIVITLLVLELHVPGADESDDLLGALKDDWRSFAAYLISFAFVGGVWTSHSAATRLLARSDGVLFQLNLVLLFFVSLLPFTTSLMSTHVGDSGESAAVAIFGLDLFAASLLMTVFMGYAVRAPGLIADDVADKELAAVLRQRWVFLAAQGALTVVAVVWSGAAVALYLLIAMASLGLPLLRARRAPEGPVAP